jgi:plasmid stability protein
MKAITLRNIPEQLAKRIEERARRSRKSLNQTVIEILDERTSVNKQQLYHDLDHLVGTWAEDEAKAFNTELEAQRGIDPELWK